MKAMLLSLILLTGSALADEASIRIKDGAGKDKVLANCVSCHSIDYIPMNSVFLDRSGWTATVNKMVKAFGAPIQGEDIPQIVDYLSRYYGKG